eukprot:CAMPEP_0194217344 /NCGR_PEP_ID=MMETSP0156-20130528/21036_1 /TAXON_ID=33649 /ORGANISM="Thalassionema nitzschioides, Strain L26-B" /LENGTH=462 /DNA_ID=CAMNT_0038946367 /DNA_START=318 /DNA_END=1706 /DNA_ORIENTATION=+
MKFGPSQTVVIQPAIQEVERDYGSLPLKKRKIHYISPEDPIAAPKFGSRDAESPVPYARNVQDEALNLLATASGALESTSRKRSTSLSPLLVLSRAAEVANRKTPRQMAEAVYHSVQMTPQGSVLPNFGPPSVTPGVGDIKISLPSSGGASSGSLSKTRVHHPPLSSPLPNGCHGRTSRNNSYCRRQPCYNGSKYCKLHYQQYIVAGTRIHVDQGKVTLPDCGPSANTPIGSSHQDKRFTGSGDEVRCSATTTRGRECAYVAVRDGKYCHLHADYDTNPPPKRGRVTSGMSNSRQSLNKIAVLCGMQGCPSIPDLCHKSFSLAPRKSALMPIDGAKITVSVCNDEQSHGPDSKKFLSSISSDQWLNQKVKIATGPLANRIGRVEKWGNGWVTVRVRDDLAHNRRSVELLLMAEDDKGTTKEKLLEVDPKLPNEVKSLHYDFKHGVNRPKLIFCKPSVNPSVV